MHTQYIFNLISTVAFCSAGLLLPRGNGSPTHLVRSRATEALIIPTQGATAALDPPPPSVTLQFVTLGHGIQNYSCDEVGSPGKSTGALAVLYDVTSLYSGLNESQRNTLSPNMLKLALPLNLANTTGNQFAAVAGNAFKEDASLSLKVPGHCSQSVKVIGHHFFESTIPIFDLYNSPDKLFFAGNKTRDVQAPVDSNPGFPPTETGAVNWLSLEALSSSRGVSLVYRVSTAGGNSTKCTEVNQQISIPYAAEYWFYGPSN